MINETPIEILELPNQLTNMFADKLPAATTGNAEEKRSNFLSRALAAYALHRLSGCSLSDAASSVVDGGGDGGIDAIFYATASATMFIVQSKYITKGRGEPDLGDVTKFKTGLENVLQGNFEPFSKNTAWTERWPEIKSQLERMGQVKPVLVYSGINVVSEDRLTMFEDLKRRFVDEDNFIDLQICNLTRVHSWLVGSDAGLGIAQVELNLLKPGWLKEPYETVYGLLTLQELANLYEQYGKKLVVANIRGYKGTTDVNDKILETIESEPEHFFYLNNGLTAYCDRLEVNNLDRANADFKRVTAYGLSIVNGAQTLGSIAEFFKKNPEAMPEGNVFIKIISLRNCSDDREFAANITRSTNFQNRINAQDFVSLDEQQERIANQLVLSGIFYHYKDEADLPDPDESNFTMREAITALACLVKRPDCDDFCARILANRASLWSMQGDTENSSIYERIFRADRSARTVWRAVQTQRLVLQVMKDNGRAETGVRKAFFENARWVLLHVVFIKCQSAQGDLLALTELEVSNIRRCAVELAERLWTVCEDQGYVSRGSESQVRHFRSVFSSAVDCEQLRRGLLQALKNT